MMQSVAVCWMPNGIYWLYFEEAKNRAKTFREKTARSRNLRKLRRTQNPNKTPSASTDEKPSPPWPQERKFLILTFVAS
jgi:hypothetical protein